VAESRMSARRSVRGDPRAARTVAESRTWCRSQPRVGRWR
jgi:hypothetical protein